MNEILNYQRSLALTGQIIKKVVRVTNELEEEIAPLPAMTEALAGKRQRFAAHLALR